MASIIIKIERFNLLICFIMMTRIDFSIYGLGIFIFIMFGVP